MGRVLEPVLDRGESDGDDAEDAKERGAPATEDLVQRSISLSWMEERNLPPRKPIGSTCMQGAGYLRIKTESGWVLLHRHVMEEHIGRKLERHEVVHHLNHDRLDNRIENLQLCESAHEHYMNHRRPLSNRRKPGQENPEIPCGCGCGQMIRRFGARDYLKRYAAGHSPTRKQRSDTRLSSPVGPG